METDKLRIIIIDDDSSINLLLKTALVKLGHHVQTFSDPTYCLAVQDSSCTCPREFPCADVIISDIVMPKMNGIAFFKHQRECSCKIWEENKALISATTDSNHFDEIEELGYTLLKKPFKIAELVQWIEECADRLSHEPESCRALAT